MLSPKQAKTSRFFTPHSLPVTTGSGQTNIHCCSSYLYIRKLPTVRFDLCKSPPMSINYSDNSLCWPKSSSQSYTSPILGEPAIPQSEAKLPYQLWVHQPMNPPHSRLNHQPSSPQRTGQTTPNLRSVQTCYTENDRPRGRSLYSPQNF